jgi:hypothetical protein
VPLTPGQLVRRVHGSPLRLVLAATGGGASSIEQLLVVPGASRTVLEAVVPYAAAALQRFLGGVPKHYCSAETARWMAMAALQRACELAQREPESADVPLAGIGCTASLATDRDKRGPHRAHVAVQTATVTSTHTLEFLKGRRTRAQEEKLLGRLVLNLIAQAADVPGRLDVRLFEDEVIATEDTPALPGWSDLLLGRVPAVRHGSQSAIRNPKSAIFPGAFHPRHSGHVHLAEVATRRLGAPVEYEISILNVDKPPLDFTEMQRRLAQFSPSETVWFTRAPLFQTKADLFPGATFLVGADTIRRIGDVRYYAHDASARDQAIEHLAKRGCRFLVFGRLLENEFRTLSDLDLPQSLSALCEEIPAGEFREDVSSTEIRQKAE